MASSTSAATHTSSATSDLNCTAPDVLNKTLECPNLLCDFRVFLRKLDNTTNSSIEDHGKFERGLDFLISSTTLFGIPESDLADIKAALIAMYNDFFNVPPSKRLSIASSQVALKRLREHLQKVSEDKEAPDSGIVRPVFEDVYSKMQKKHDVFTKNWKPPTTQLRAVLCSIF